jgi:tRNA pseudouridine38-40 synthase
MPRYFLEVAYKGTNYSGFQVQENAVTIQSEVERGLEIFFKQKIKLTGSSRTDAGVHAKQNFFHFDTELSVTESDLYHINAIIPSDIVTTKVKVVSSNAHCRFDALAREYEYFIYRSKDPFKADRGWFYPYKLNIEILQETAAMILLHNNFESFAKRNTQVNNYICSIQHSEWREKDGFLIYSVRANRFLRGMVRGLVGTMVKMARKELSHQGLHTIFEARDCSLADFTTPPQGLFLSKVIFPVNYF